MTSENKIQTQISIYIYSQAITLLVVLLFKNKKNGYYKYSKAHILIHRPIISQYRRIYMITSFVKTMCDFSFRGRSTSKEFLNFTMIWLLITLLASTFILTMGISVLGIGYNASGELIISGNMRALGILPIAIMSLLTACFIMFQIWAFISASLLSIRRLHDINFSGVCYWVWISAILFLAVGECSLLTAILFYFVTVGVIVLASAKSYTKPNKYGNVIKTDIYLGLKNGQAIY